MNLQSFCVGQIESEDVMFSLLHRHHVCEQMLPRNPVIIYRNTYHKEILNTVSEFSTNSRGWRIFTEHQ